MFSRATLVRRAAWGASLAALVAVVALTAVGGASPAEAQTIYLDFTQGRVAISPEQRAGSFSVNGVALGDYEARLYRDSGYTVILRVRFRVS